MQISKKKEAFCQFFVAFWKCKFNFEHFPKIDDPHS